MRKNSCGEPEHNCEACEDEWFGDERTNGTVIEHTCGKETLSKLTPENIKKAAKMANQDQRDLMDKALPGWERNFKDHLKYFEDLVSDYKELLKEIIEAHISFSDFTRQTIETEREQAVKDFKKSKEWKEIMEFVGDEGDAYNLIYKIRGNN